MNCDHEDVTLDVEMERNDIQRQHDIVTSTVFKVTSVVTCNECGCVKTITAFANMPKMNKKEDIAMLDDSMAIPDTIEELTNG